MGNKAVVATNKLTINNDEGMTLIYRENFAVLQLDFMVATPYPLCEADDTVMHCSNEKGEDDNKVSKLLSRPVWNKTRFREYLHTYQKMHKFAFG